MSNNHTVTATAEPLTHSVGEALQEAINKSGYWDTFSKIPTKMPKEGFSVGDLYVLIDTRGELIFTLGNLATAAQRGERNKTARDKISRRIRAINALLAKHEAVLASK